MTIICLIIVFWFVGFFMFIEKIYQYPEDLTTKTDAIVILTGGRNRIAEGAKIWNQGLSEKLFISGIEKNTSLKTISNVQEVNFINLKNVDFEKKSKNTIENAIETNEWLDRKRVV